MNFLMDQELFHGKISEDGHKLEKSAQYHITVTTGFFLHLKQFRSIKIFDCITAISFPVTIRIVSNIFSKSPKNICGFHLYERALFFILVHRVFQDMAAMVFDRYLLKQTLFTKKRTKSLELFLRKSQKTATNHVFLHTYLYKFNNPCYIKKNQHKENLVTFLVFDGGRNCAPVFVHCSADFCPACCLHFSVTILLTL